MSFPLAQEETLAGKEIALLMVLSEVSGFAAARSSAGCLQPEVFVKRHHFVAIE
jgi:hypothetical protein